MFLNYHFRPVDTPQSYNKSAPLPTQTRSAASPLSPPRPGQGAANTFPPFSAGVTAREAPLRTHYGTHVYCNSVSPYRDNSYTPRLKQIQADYRTMPFQPTPNLSLSISIGSTNTTDTVPSGGGTTVNSNTLGPMVSSGNIHGSIRPRISLLPHSNTTNDYGTNRSAQAPPDPGGQPSSKRIRLSENTATPPPPLLQIDVRDQPTVSTGAYHPQVEAISPTLPNEPTEDSIRAAKDALLLEIAKVDSEIENAQNKISMLKKQEAQLEEASNKPQQLKEKAEVPTRHRSLAQKVYMENRKKAAAAHALISDKLGPPVELPLYNQPSDVDACKKVIQLHPNFKDKLIAYISKIKGERAAKNTAMAEKYTVLSQDWLKRVEKIQSGAKRKAREAKAREYFERVFVELRKQREDKERFSRVGSRIKSEADLEEIMDGLQEQVCVSHGTGNP